MNIVNYHAFASGLPTSHRFAPTDYELFELFLRPRVHGFQPSVNPFYEFDLYQQHPSILTAFTDYKCGSWYCLSPRYKKTVNGILTKRTVTLGVGGPIIGKWFHTNSEREVLTGNLVSGYKRDFEYRAFVEQPLDQLYLWKMSEFSLTRTRNYESNANDGIYMNRLVVCVVRREQRNLNIPNYAFVADPGNAVQHNDEMNDFNEDLLVNSPVNQWYDIQWDDIQLDDILWG